MTNVDIVRYGEELILRPESFGGYLSVCGWPEQQWGCGPNIVVQPGAKHTWVIEGKDKTSPVKYGDVVKIRSTIPRSEQEASGWDKGSEYLSPCGWADNVVKGPCQYNVSLRSDKGYYAYESDPDFMKSLRLWSIEGGPTGTPVPKDTPVTIKSLMTKSYYPIGSVLSTCGDTSDSCGKNVTILNGTNSNASKKWVFERPNSGLGFRPTSPGGSTPAPGEPYYPELPEPSTSGGGLDKKVWIIIGVMVVIFSLFAMMAMMIFMK
jgi:hypothetical protein